MSAGRPPERGPEFEMMMAEIDAKLISDGVEIASRPIFAVREIALKYDLNIPLGRSSLRLPLDLQENVELSEAINQWYHDNYGDRLKEDPCPGKIVMSLDGDLYILRVPRIFGSVNFVLTREWLPHPGISRGPTTCNILQLVDVMTPAKAARLSDKALNAVAAAFETGVPAAYTLECTDHPLMWSARGDVEVAVNSLMSRGGRFGESKWASLQAAEKVLKAATNLSGGEFKFTHDLAELAQTLADTGLAFDASAQVAAIQCKASIRYGDETCTCDEALAAHQASLELVNVLREAGARFAQGIDDMQRAN